MLEVKIYRRFYGTGPYVLFQTVGLLATADGAGNATFSGTVPNNRGFETYASCS